MLWRWPCTRCHASRGLWTCTMACMLPLIKRKQMMRGKPRKKVILVERDSLVQRANVKTGKVSRRLEPTREHAGDTNCTEWWSLMIWRQMSDFNVKCQMLNVGCQMLNVKCFGLMSSHDLISPSRAPVKKAVLQHCVDCGLNFEGLDELRDHLKVAWSLWYSNEPPHEGGGRRTKPCVPPSLWCRFFHTGFGHKEDDTFKRRPQKILQDLLV